MPFAIANRTVNPLVGALLHSPGHAVLSGRMTLITVTGRRSGRRHTLPVAYRPVGDQIVIHIAFPEHKRWWRNLRGGAPVELLLRGITHTGRAEAHEDPDGGVTVSVALDAA